MFRGTLTHAGAYQSPGAQVEGVKKWQFHTDGYVFSTPAVVDGVAYFGSSDGNLYAVESGAGTQKWKFATGSRVNASPAVADGRVYFSSYDGFFYAVDAKTGQLRWKFQTRGERRFAGKHLHGSLPAAETMPDPWDFYLSSPGVWKGRVYFGSGDGNVYALDSSSGALRWKFKTGDVVHASPALSDGVVFIGSWDGFFYAIDAETGKEKWRFKTGEDEDTHNQVGIQSSAAVADGTVYFGCRDSNLYALDASTGKQRWVYNTKYSWVIGSPAVDDGKVYFATSDTALFHAVDAKTGVSIFSLDLKGWPLFSSPTVAGNMVYIGSMAGKLFVIDLKKQTIAWAFQTDASRAKLAAYSKPDGGTNYDLLFGRAFYDEAVVGVSEMLSLGSIMSSPVVTEEGIYLGSTDGNLYLIE